MINIVFFKKQTDALTSSIQTIQQIAREFRQQVNIYSDQKFIFFGLISA
jgi:hypothetical protein